MPLARLDRCERRNDRIHPGQSIFDLIGTGTDQNDGEPSARGGLLVRDSLVDRQQDVVARDFGGLEQLTILLALQTRPLSGVGVMGWKAAPEVERQALPRNSPKECPPRCWVAKREPREPRAMTFTPVYNGAQDGG
jgi:hypothetical protein